MTETSYPPHKVLFDTHLEEDYYDEHVRRMAWILAHDLPELPSSLAIMQALLRLDQEVRESHLIDQRQELVRRLNEVDQALLRLRDPDPDPDHSEEDPA